MSLPKYIGWMFNRTYRLLGRVRVGQGRYVGREGTIIALLYPSTVIVNLDREPSDEDGSAEYEANKLWGEQAQFNYRELEPLPCHVSVPFNSVGSCVRDTVEDPTAKKMTPNEYHALALRTQADQERILRRLVELGPRFMQMDNAARGLANDAGEVAEIVKNAIEYGKPFGSEQRLHMIEELGDLYWRASQMCAAIGATPEEVMEANIRKLAKRFGDKYTDWAADPANRDRTAEAQAVAAQATQVSTLPPVARIVDTPLHGVATAAEAVARQQEQAGESKASLASQLITDERRAKSPFGTDTAIIQDTQGFGHADADGEAVEAELDALFAAPEKAKRNLVRAPLDADYPDYCRCCGTARVHKNNRVKICGDCYKEAGKQA